MTRSSSSRLRSSAAASKPSSDLSASRSKFDLIAELGRGGMATVYLARAKRTPNRFVVLKQLRPDLSENVELVDMFLEEARLAGRLSHPNIVETYEVGIDAGVHYIAMEYVDGLTLQAILAELGWNGAFTFWLHSFVLTKVLRGLDHAYNQRDDDGNRLRIVHRDVTPQNIVVGFDGSVKLVDFGIAKAASTTIETRTGLIKGKLTYMAPEQAQSGDVDERTDVYSVGVMLWQAVAGTRRWKGIQNTDVLKRLHAGDVVDSPDAASHGLPVALDRIVMDAIAGDSEQRTASAKELGRQLERMLESTGHFLDANDLATFMRTTFGQAHLRARRLIDRRIVELDALEPLTEPAKSGSDAAAHSSTRPKVGERVSTKQVAAVESPVRPKEDSSHVESAAAPHSLTTRASAQKRRKADRLFLVASFIVALAVAYDVWAIFLSPTKTQPAHGDSVRGISTTSPAASAR